MPQCSICGRAESECTFNQNQSKRLRAGKAAYCLECAPVRADFSAADDATKLYTAFANRESGGAMDGKARTLRGKKRKAKTPPAQATMIGKHLFQELQAVYCVKTFQYQETLERVCQKYLDEMEHFEAYSAMSLRASVRLQEVRSSHELLRSFEWLNTNEQYKLPAQQQFDFMTTLPMRGLAHGTRTRVCMLYMYAHVCMHMLRIVTRACVPHCVTRAMLVARWSK